MSLPALFVSHGSPMVALDHDAYTEALAGFGASLPAFRAAVVVSAHWQTPLPTGVTAAERPSLLYDFGGFPPKLYQLVHPCPGDPALAARVVERLAAGGFGARLEPARGLDHGVWVPARHMFPTAGTPIVQLALPALAPAGLLAFGRALAPLRDEGVLLVGSGGIVHNLRRLSPAKDAPVVDWARAFDDWIAAHLTTTTLDDAALAALVDYRARAPHADLAVPTSEHLDPMFVVLGAAVPGDRFDSVHASFQHGTLSMRSFALWS